MKLYVFLIFSTISFTIYSQNSSKTEALIINLSALKNNYLNKNGAEKLAPLLDDRLVFIHTNGLVESKTEMIEHLKTEKWAAEKVEVQEAKVRVFKNNVAILNGKGRFYVIANGERKELDILYTEVWTHFKKGWILASRHGSKI